MGEISLGYLQAITDAPLSLIRTADDNVYAAHSLALMDRLFNDGTFDDRVYFLPVANLTHMIPSPQILERMWQRIASFLSH